MNSHIFSDSVLTWFDLSGRKDLPWQHPVTAYRVWVSEIMLQQTQVVTVIPYFNHFIQQYPNVRALASAPLDEVLSLWAGLGYYARARNLYKAANTIVELDHFPNSLEGLISLPGIGKSTAGAILSIAFNKSHPILDGNVRRVLARYKAIDGWTGSASISKELWSLSKLYTPTVRVADYTQAIMDLGATICTRSKPQCTVCPIQSSCLALQQSRVNELPTPKPRKKIPIKQSIFMVIINKEQQFFLEKRASVGIWGGLWSIPELEQHSDIESWLQTKALIVTSTKQLAIRRHTFSHYHLDFRPVIVYVDNPINIVLDATTTLWYKHKKTENIALPAPIKQLFDELNKE